MEAPIFPDRGTFFADGQPFKDLSVRWIQAKAFDVALVVSGDGDLCPAFRAAARLHPTCRLLAVFPPKRHSDELRRVAYASFTIGESNLRKSLLPDSVTAADGSTYTRPPTWK